MGRFNNRSTLQIWGKMAVLDFPSFAGADAGNAVGRREGGPS
jgi:hypothetical protein